jgi:4-amino-4-deoxy-L-arabinose transferase-like glycosyltransferase
LTAKRRAAIAAALVLIAGVAVARVSATHRTFAATADETQHIAAGIEWLRAGSATEAFDLWRKQKLWHVMGNPPLARIAVGAGPLLAGTRDTTVRDVLYDGPGYMENLVAGRRGVLPFLVLLIGLVWWAARRMWGDVAGLVSAAAVSTLPPILAHAGFATVDVAAAATYLLAFLMFLRWLEAPSRGRAAALGVAFGLAFATKMSALTLVPAAVVVAFHRSRTGTAPLLGGRRAVVGQLALAAGAAALAAWALYRFSFGRPDALGDPATVRYLVDHCAGGGLMNRLVSAILHLPMPAPQIADGMLVLCATNGPAMSASYLLGRITLDGFPLFFPVALLVKTPIPFLVLAFIGVRACVKDQAPERWRRLAPGLVALTVLVSVLSSRINIGVRHVLQIYPLMALYVGPGVLWLWRATRERLGRTAAVGLAAWQLTIPFLAAPDYLPWFNALAGRHPEDVLLDSDLDWGQDLLRLERELAARKVQRMSIAYFGISDLCRHRLPPGRWLRPYQRVTGTVVVSQMYRKGVVGGYYRDGNYCDRAQMTPEAKPDYDQFAWLDAYQPVARVGASILVYEIPEAAKP